MDPMTDDELYAIYRRTAEKVGRGEKLSNLDFGELSVQGFQAYERPGQVAVAIGSEDGTRKAATKSKAELVEAIKQRVLS